MSDITRPNRPVPTKARRTPPPPPVVPPVILVPGMPPMPPVAPPPAGTSQTIIYVQVPAAPASEPRKQVEFVPVRRKPARQTGLLAMMAVLIGVVGGVAAFRTEVVAVSPAIAATGFVVGLIALFRSTFLSRTTFRAPLLGMLVSFVAYVLAANNTRHLQSEYDRVRGWTGGRAPALSLARFEPKPPPVEIARPPVPAVVAAPPAGGEPAVPPKTKLPAAVTGSTATPGTTPTPTPTAVAPTPDSTPAPNRRDLSFLDPRSGGWITPGENKPAAPAATPANLKPAAPVVPTVDLPTAEQHLAAARAAAAVKMNVDYTAALSAADAASKGYDTASQTYSPGSAELAAASQQKIDAKAKVSQLQAQLDTDPAVAAAEREVRAAKGK